MAKTLTKEDVIVRGGPYDGLRMLAHIMDDGTAQIQGAKLFMPDGFEDYYFDADAMELVYQGQAAR